MSGTTQHLAVRDAVAALIVASGAVAGRVYENRDYPLQEAVASHVQVYRMQSVPERELVSVYAPVDWLTTLRIVIKARKDGATSAEVAADTIAATLYAALMADQTLDGLAMEMLPGPFAWDQDEADTNVAMVLWDCEVRHRTASHAVT